MTGVSVQRRTTVFGATIRCVLRCCWRLWTVAQAPQPTPRWSPTTAALQQSGADTMISFADNADQLDSRSGLTRDERTRLQQMPEQTSMQAYRALLDELLLDDDHDWRTDTGRDARGWTAAELQRFELWNATGWSVSDAWNAVRFGFGLHLVKTGRIGDGDEVLAR